MPERLEDRLRRYLSDRQVSPPADLERRSLERIFEKQPRSGKGFGLLPQLAAAALVVLLGLGLAWAFQASRQPAGNRTTPSPTPSVSVTPSPTVSGKPVPAGTPLSAIRMINSTSGWAIERDANALLRTVDGARTWTQVLSAGSAQVSNYFALNSDAVWVTEKDGTSLYVLQTKDGGSHWQRSTPLPVGNAADVLSMDFVDLSHGWAVLVAQSGLSGVTSLWRTVDGGMHWSQLKPASGSCAIGEISFLTPTTGWGVSCGLYQTSDGGATWQPQPISPASSGGTVAVFTAPTFFGQHNGYLVRQLTSTSQIGDQGSTTVYFTSDGGRTWTGRTTPSAGSLATFTFVDPLHGWYVAKADGSLMRTSDGGQHWTPISHDPALQPKWPLLSLQFTNLMVGFAQPGQQGQPLLKTVDGGRTWAPVS